MKQKKTPQVAQRESDSKNRLKAEPYIQQPLDYIWPSIIAAIAFLLYANTLQHGYVLDDARWAQIIKAREYFEEFGSVPPIRKFAKYLNEEQNAVFKLWMTGPMKPITKYGGLPKPTGCV